MPTIPNSAILVFTKKSVAQILQARGSDWWHMSLKAAEAYEFVLCVRSGVDLKDGDPPQGSAFLLGRISGFTIGQGGKRKRILISEYATIDVPNVWGGWRNPVHYSDLSELGIDVSKLQFLPVNSGATAPASPAANLEQVDTQEPLTIQQAKLGLAKHLGVALDAIEIVIRG